MRVVIATNEPVLARGFEAILTSGGVEIADICTDVAHVFQGVLQRQPNVVILDMGLGPMQSMLLELRKLAPSCHFVIWPRQISDRQAKELVRYGARAVLPSEVTPEVLVGTLRMLDAFPEVDPTPAALVKQVCNPLERRILSLVGCGMRNEEIAAAVRTDRQTVDQEVRNLSQRFGVLDRYELALYGLSIANEPIPNNGGESLWKNETVSEWY
jgi:DNA-binding NarL/FixJ family response regulator